MRKGKILIIEDMALIAMELESALLQRIRAGGFPEFAEADIVTLGNHDKADDWLALHPGECALIISDNETGNKNGKSGVDWVVDFLGKKTSIGIPVFFLSGSLTPEITDRLARAGVKREHIFDKPFRTACFIPPVIAAYEALPKRQTHAEAACSTRQLSRVSSSQR